MHYNKHYNIILCNVVVAVLSVYVSLLLSPSLLPSLIHLSLPLHASVLSLFPLFPPPLISFGVISLSILFDYETICFELKILFGVFILRFSLFLPLSTCLSLCNCLSIYLSLSIFLSPSQSKCYMRSIPTILISPKIEIYHLR